MSERIVKLNPCPFCGGTAHVKYYVVPGYYIDADHTKTCGVKPNTQSLPSKVLRTHIKKWNTRTQETYIKPIGTPNQIRALYNLPPIDEYSKYAIVKRTEKEDLEDLEDLSGFNISFLEDAYKIKDMVSRLIKNYDNLTMADLLQMLDIKVTYRDNRFGWTDEDDIWIEITDNNTLLVRYNDPKEV